MRGLGAVTGSTDDPFPYVALYALERSSNPRSSLLLWICEKGLMLEQHEINHLYLQLTSLTDGINSSIIILCISSTKT